MRNHNSLRAVRLFLALFMLATGPTYTQAFDNVTLMSPNEEGSGWFGYSVAAAGDVNHDGSPDVIVGAWFEDPGTSPSDAGRAYVFSGQDGSLLFELITRSNK